MSPRLVRFTCLVAVGGLVLGGVSPASATPPHPRGGGFHPTAMNVHAPGGPGFHGGGRPPGPHPGPHPGPGPEPGPGPGPHPGPGPGPHPPGPGPGPHPPPPPPPPPGPWGWGWDDDPFWNYPLATAATIGVVAGATAAVTSAALGGTVTTLPSSCVTVFRDDLTYFQCGSVWYQPRYAGLGVTYVVVNAP